MTLPVILHSKMQNAPKLRKINGSYNALLLACLVNGFNSITATGCTITSGVATINLASHGFSALDSVAIAGASQALLNGTKRVSVSNAGNITVAVPGAPDGTVTGTITVKFAPLGWTRPYSSTNNGAYRQGGSSATKRYLKVTDDDLVNDTGYVRVRGYEAMTSITAGTGPFPDLTQSPAPGPGWTGVAYIPDTDEVPWIIVGTPRCFYIMNGYNVTYLPGEDFNKTDTYSQFFGELARINKPGDNFAHLLTSYSFPSGDKYLPRDVTGTGTSSADAVINSASGASTFNLGLEYPDPADGGIKMFDLPVVNHPTSLRGCMPGLVPVSANYYLDLNNKPGMFFTNVDGVTGRLLMMDNEAAGSAGVYCLLADEDWGDV